MKYFGNFSADGYLHGVFSVDDNAPLEDQQGEPLLEWTGWPAAPEKYLRLRLVAGALVWQDPRSHAQQAAEGRAQRDALLAATDWMALRDLEGGDKITVAWKTYRKALRDLPTQPGWPGVITWPVEPR